MEKSGCRLYSGPLSLEAQKILKALQAQKHQTTRQIHRTSRHDHRLENRRHGGPGESSSQSYTSQQLDRDAHPFWTICSSQCSDYETVSSSQSFQTPDALRPSQASCASWEPPPCSGTNSAGPCFQLSPMYSQMSSCEPPVLQSSQAPLFSQCDVSEANTCLFQDNRYSQSLQTLPRLSKHQSKAQKRSDKITPQFSVEFPSEITDDFFQKTPGQKVVAEEKCLFERSVLVNKSSSSDDRNRPMKRIRLNNSFEKELECGLHVINKVLVKESKAPEEEEKTMGIFVSDTNPDDQLGCNKSDPLTFNGTTSDITFENQPALSDSQTPSVSPQRKVFNGNYIPPELSDGTKERELPSAKGPLAQSGSGDVLSERADEDGEYSKENEDTLELASEEAEQNKQDPSIDDANEAQTSCICEVGDQKVKGKERDSMNKDVNLTNMELTEATVVSKSRNLQSDVSSRSTSVLTHESNDYKVTNLKVEEDTQANPKLSPQRATSHSREIKSLAAEGNTMSSSSGLDHSQSSVAQRKTRMMPSTLPIQPQSKSCVSLKRKYEAPRPRSTNNIATKNVSAKPPHKKWVPPRPSQEQSVQIDDIKNNILPEAKQTGSYPLSETNTQSSAQTGRPIPKLTKYVSKSVQNRLKPGSAQKEARNQSKSESVTSSLTLDPRVTHASKMSIDEMNNIVKNVQGTEAVVLTVMFRDGTTQLDPEQKLTPPVCGLLLLIKHDLDNVSETLGPNDCLVYFKLEHAPAWAQQSTPHRQQTVTRDLLLQVFWESKLLVCFKAKDMLRALLQFYKRELTGKQVVGGQLHDPQVSGWLLDPADPASCFQDLRNKHCKMPHSVPALGHKKVSQIIAGLCSLYKLNKELGSKLQRQELWHLYSDVELKMIPVLAAMEVCHIHVDKEALRRTSDLLGTKMKQLEQEAHRAAGQKFLLTSSTQLRTVLFEKLHLHERCESKKLPKTINNQQSTSEAALLQLQDLHPLPKIVLEYRQIHKIKSTFVDGILSCMMTKNYISSTWHQTSVVTGRISATHPNFQALPRQPLQVTRNLCIAGEEEEVVTVHPRAMFVPKEGWTFLSADFCQVELRLLAHLSSDPELLRVFASPEADVFSMLASQWKGVSEKEVTSEDREHAKRIVYSVVYGAGSERLSGILGVSTEQARKFQDSFLQTYKEVQTFIQKTVTECQNKGYVLSIMGRRRNLHNINSSDWGIRMQAERQAVNFVVQGSAADLCKMAMIRIFNLLTTSSSLPARLVAQLHDELLYEVEDSQVEPFAALVKSIMESLANIEEIGVRLRVPLKVGVSSGKSWGAMSELSVSQTRF